MKTMILVLLDRTGSMRGSESDVVGGINKFLAEQRVLPDPCVLAMARFDSQQYERFRAMVPIADVKDLTLDEFQPRSMTPLLDAMGKSMVALDADWLTEKPDQCIVVVYSDGAENESHEFTKAQIKDMVKAREASEKWKFIFLGADMDAFGEASAMGVRASGTVAFEKSAVAYASASAHVSDGVALMRAGKVGLDVNLSAHVDKSGKVDKIDASAAAAPAAGDLTKWVAPTQ